MADGGIAMQESPNVEWTQERGLNAADQRLLSVKLGLSNNEPTQRPLSTPTVEQLMQERDEMWREHGRSLCNFMEREHGRFLRVLHQEIEQLQKKCGDVTLELASALTGADGIETGTKASAQLDTTKTRSTIEHLQHELATAKNELTALQQLNENKDQKISLLERQYNEYEIRFRDDADRKSKKIKEITTELNQKAAVITQVMTQLHQLRLREAVEKQKRQLGEQSRRRQMLLTHNNTVANAWLQGAIASGRDSVHSMDGQEPVHRPRMLTSPTIVRSSILPPIFASSAISNIEKPGTNGPAKPFRSSFRRSSSSHGPEQ